MSYPLITILNYPDHTKQNNHRRYEVQNQETGREHVGFSPILNGRNGTEIKNIAAGVNGHVIAATTASYLSVISMNEVIDKLEEGKEKVELDWLSKQLTDKNKNWKLEELFIQGKGDPKAGFSVVLSDSGGRLHILNYSLKGSRLYMVGKQTVHWHSSAADAVGVDEDGKQCYSIGRERVLVSYPLTASHIEPNLEFRSDGPENVESICSGFLERGLLLLTNNNGRTKLLHIETNTFEEKDLVPEKHSVALGSQSLRDDKAKRKVNPNTLFGYSESEEELFYTNPGSNSLSSVYFVKYFQAKQDVLQFQPLKRSFFYYKHALNHYVKILKRSKDFLLTLDKVEADYKKEINSQFTLRLFRYNQEKESKFDQVWVCTDPMDENVVEGVDFIIDKAKNIKILVWSCYELKLFVYNEDFGGQLFDRTTLLEGSHEGKTKCTFVKETEQFFTCTLDGNLMRVKSFKVQNNNLVELAETSFLRENEAQNFSLQYSYGKLFFCFSGDGVFVLDIQNMKACFLLQANVVQLFLSSCDFFCLIQEREIKSLLVLQQSSFTLKQVINLSNAVQKVCYAQSKGTLICLHSSGRIFDVVLDRSKSKVKKNSSRKRKGSFVGSRAKSGNVQRKRKVELNGKININEMKKEKRKQEEMAAMSSENLPDVGALVKY
eukprot:augustus_masked-scaffold_12-processed-gene-3.12-mRNA-1 protein AED:1.00 eAED:1.00 QI:0/0/0/0/1/1/2/0/661